MQRGTSTLLGIALTLLPLSAAKSDVRTHDRWFARATAGFGYAHTSHNAYWDQQFFGSAAAASIAAGWVVAPNLALHGSFFGWFARSPEARFHTFQPGRDPLVIEADGDVGMSALGIGLTYYVMPANVCISASFGAGQVEFHNNVKRGMTDWGFAFEFNLGKEWWVSDGWALGFAGVAKYHDMPDAGPGSSRWDGVNLGFVLAVTFD